MLYIAICDDDEGVCAELERMLYDYAEQNKIQIDIDIWYRGESLCRFLRSGTFYKRRTGKHGNCNCLHFSEQQLCDGFISCTAYRFSDQTFRQNKSWECHEQDSENFGSQKRYFRVLWQWILFQGII